MQLTWVAGLESVSEAAGEAPTGPGALPDLPLWRVQWASLPGTQVTAKVLSNHAAEALIKH